MKKYTVAIIGIMFAILVFGSCEQGKTGGIIEIENQTTVNSASVKIHITIANLFSETTLVDEQDVDADDTGTFSSSEDGFFIINANYIDPTTKKETLLKKEQITLSGGNTVSFIVDKTLP